MANEAMMPMLPVTRSMALTRASIDLLPYRAWRDKKTGRPRAPFALARPISSAP
jgi:hypothetical protein